MKLLALGIAALVLALVLLRQCVTDGWPFARGENGEEDWTPPAP